MHVVLLEPEIAGNTGNIGRSCVGTDTTLHLIGPRGFELDSARIRRAGLDYWPKLDLQLHASWDAFKAQLPAKASLLFFSAEGGSDFWQAPYEADSYLIFGKESVGLPADIRQEYKEHLYRVPTNDKIRSLNLSSCAAVVLFEGMRRLRS
jgi:tRNA (cytidine/uridine-2'-O-)-methyltransferase